MQSMIRLPFTLACTGIEERDRRKRQSEEIRGAARRSSSLVLWDYMTRVYCETCTQNREAGKEGGARGRMDEGRRV